MRSCWLIGALAGCVASCEASTDGGPPGGPGEPCGVVECPGGYVCLDGACLPDDGCGQIRCDAGFACSRGQCAAVGTDADGDGAFVEDDCDDGDPDVGPGTEVECSTECGGGLRICSEGDWTACTAPTECEPEPDPEPDPEPEPEPDPCAICDPEHHVAVANGEACDCAETWRVVFAESFGAPVSQVCRDGTWQAYNWNPRDPAACCAGDFTGCEGS